MLTNTQLMKYLGYSEEFLKEEIERNNSLPMEEREKLKYKMMHITGDLGAVSKSKEKYSELNQKEHYYKYKKYVGFSKDGENVILTVEKRKYNEDRNFWINEFKDKIGDYPKYIHVMKYPDLLKENEVSILNLIKDIEKTYHPIFDYIDSDELKKVITNEINNQIVLKHKKDFLITEYIEEFKLDF